jgi:hypothetical protein
MVYSIVTEKKYIPCNKNGESNFLVLESDGSELENKYVYVMINHISTVEFDKLPNGKTIIKLYVTGKNEYFNLNSSDRELLFNIINSYMDEDDSEEDDDASNMS